MQKNQGEPGEKMRFSTIALAGLCLCLLPGMASGEPFASEQYGFTADFPATPIVGKPRPSETNDRGKVIAKSVIIKTQIMGVYTAMVTVDSYIVPTKLNTSATLSAMTQGFAAQLDARITSSRFGRVDGHRARFFNYRTSDRASSGKGVIVVVQSRKPRTYMVLSMHTSLASDDDVAALNKFVASFHVK